MAVWIGSARINENGETEGGQLGDQTGEECMIEEWYLHYKGWYVIRPKDPDKGALMAQDMVYLCNNPNIGYSYWENSNTLYYAAQPFGFNCSLVDIPCDTNCSRGVRVCALFAGYNIDDFSTGDEIAVFSRTGEFDILTQDMYCEYPNYLRVGDILVTRTKGHTAIVVSIDDEPPIPPEPKASKRRCTISRNCVLCSLCTYGIRQR